MLIAGASIAVLGLPLAHAQTARGKVLPQVVVDKPVRAKPAKPHAKASPVATPSHVASHVASRVRRTAPVRSVGVRASAVAAPSAVASSAPGGEQSGSLTAPSVASQRQAIQQTAGSVGFVDAADPNIQTRVQQDIRDALKDTPGVFAESRYGQELRVSIRGASLTRGYHLRGIELLQDGIPFNLADGSGSFYQIDPLAYRSIGVYKGGNALLFGASTLGGAINFVSPTAYTALAPNIVRVEGGSFGTIRTNVQASRIIGNYDVLLNGTFTSSQGYRQHELGNYDQINGNIGYRFAPGAETRFFFGSYETHQLLPGTLTRANALTVPQLASAGALLGNQARNEWARRISNRTTFAFDAGTLDLDSWFFHKKLNHPIFQVLEQSGYTAGVSPRWSSTGLAIGGLRDDFFVGGRVWGGHNIAKQFVNVYGQEATPTSNARQDALNLEAYGENRLYVLPNLALMTGFKAFSDRRQYTDLGGLIANPRPKYDERTFRGIVPKVGAIWFPTPDVQVFADLTGSRDVPDFTDLTQTTATSTRFSPVVQQKAWTWEVGTRGRYDRFTWDVTLYRADIRDELLQFTTNSSIPASTFNAPYTRHQGVEFAAAVDLVRDVSGSGAGDVVNLAQVWTFNDFRFRGDAQYGFNVLAGAPRHVLRTTLSYRRPDGLYIAPAVDWVPQGAWVDYANTQRAPGYALLGLQAGLDVPPSLGLPGKLSLYLDARNLTGTHYISDLGTVTDARKVSTEVYYPGNGRSISAGARYAF